ncbi:DUF1320 domain-containing protein [Alteriqipengyuania flavescens]|uniref:DUF1320 domain-containing protein n=1 Tax=Alteriqipengyuania flavescens TaxID=3053610 RepID=UPI0025B3DF62|nr:DUF1320 domain-containing protein [Alteriqipengyuania flavescens]WJY18680.1 DUF1320 domain-containing protein [Alteriqipengyuania flavescens]WJY24620.1 DUF1320 domain-containing protein [Alteriqipengyuania flavescens]
MKLIVLVKTPAEALVHRIALGGAAVSFEAAIVEERGLVADTAPIAVDVTLEAGDLAIRLSGGRDGELYRVSVIAGLADGSEREFPIELSVIEGAWSMPDGGAAMLSVAEFVGRIGRDEALHLADLGDGRIDRALVVGALVDAQAQVEAHLSARHRLPFAVVPTLVVAIVTDLARAALYQDELPANVAERRRIALKNLDALRKGELSLGADPGVDKPTGQGGVRINPGTRAYPDGLKDYGWR